MFKLSSLQPNMSVTIERIIGIKNLFFIMLFYFVNDIMFHLFCQMSQQIVVLSLWLPITFWCLAQWRISEHKTVNKALQFLRVTTV